jgi:hypothetical protein
MIYYETGESSRNVEGRSSSGRSTEEHIEKDECNDNHKHDKQKEQKHHHRRERSKVDLDKHKTKDGASEEPEKRERVLSREKSNNSRENLRHKDEREDEDRGKDKEKDKNIDGEKDRKSSRGNRSREGIERKDSKRKNSTRHIRRASELPIAVDTESNALLRVWSSPIYRSRSLCSNLHQICYAKFSILYSHKLCKLRIIIPFLSTSIGIRT